MDYSQVKQKPKIPARHWKEENVAIEKTLEGTIQAIKASWLRTWRTREGKAESCQGMGQPRLNLRKWRSHSLRHSILP